MANLSCESVILDLRECGANLNAFLIQTPANLKHINFSLQSRF
ncbi:hypothetical protein [Helicobacter sp. T3_23-1059]